MNEKNLVVMDENGVVVGYNLYNVVFNKSELTITAKAENYAPFKCVADHRTFATLVQAIVTHRQLCDFNKRLEALAEAKIVNFKLTEAEEEELDILQNMVNYAQSMKETLDIPVQYIGKHVADYPMVCQLLANWHCGIVADFPVQKLRTLASSVVSDFVTTGKVETTEETLKEFRAVWAEEYAKKFDTKKDIIFKKWCLKFDINSVRQLVLACGIRPVKDSKGYFTYEMEAPKKCQKHVMHALLKRMQCDLAEADKPTKK